MEDKKINEQESLNLISNMIKQTNNHMALGAGNTFIAWGIVLCVVSLSANIAIAMTHNGLWMWLYMAILVVGMPLEWWMKRSAKQKSAAHVKTYIEDSVEKVWKCIGAILVIYPVMLLLLHGTIGPRVWTTMFFLGMFLPALGSYITGVMLKSKGIERVAAAAGGMSLMCLATIVEPSFVMTLSHTFVFPLCTVFSLIIPGILINRKAKADNQ